ncbi:hypothetical protein ACQCN2_19615 [Brevibacillus ginsengisoli]|uniref:hypothetical protein n=1 Tax=Brevibacillus ginsengisoli TaxID=363854 RepID=UPI003CE76C9A
MKNWLRIWLLATITCLLTLGGIAYGSEGTPTPITGDYSKFNLPPGSMVIAKQSIDVTGDGTPDIVSLVGKKLREDSPYYDQLYITVANPKDQKYITIPLQGGYNPKMKFCDFNKDKVQDIYVSVETGGSGGFTNTYLYTVKNNQSTELPVPNPLQVTGAYQDNYQVKFTIVNTGREFVLSLEDRKKEYDQAGIYKNGKLIKPPTITVNPYSLLLPVDVNHDGTCELQGVQRITGISNADTIAYAVSIWRWTDNQWSLAEANIRKTYP